MDSCSSDMIVIERKTNDASTLAMPAALSSANDDYAKMADEMFKSLEPFLHGTSVRSFVKSNIHETVQLSHELDHMLNLSQCIQQLRANTALPFVQQKTRELYVAVKRATTNLENASTLLKPLCDKQTAENAKLLEDVANASAQHSNDLTAFHHKMAGIHHAIQMTIPRINNAVSELNALRAKANAQTPVEIQQPPASESLQMVMEPKDHDDHTTRDLIIQLNQEAEANEKKAAELRHAADVLNDEITRKKVHDMEVEVDNLVDMDESFAYHHDVKILMYQRQLHLRSEEYKFKKMLKLAKRNANRESE